MDDHPEQYSVAELQCWKQNQIAQGSGIDLGDVQITQVLGVLVKSRRHETVVRDYGHFLQKQCGLQPNTHVHPRDMVVVAGDTEWLIEVKTVHRGHVAAAVREALGQLLFYRHFHYPDGHHHIRMLAVFNEDIGQACMEFLEIQSIASVWRTGARWAGSPSAENANLCG
ncbi:hypothetical protein [Actinomadura citrea]|uniref:Uncharacterized protein n=1 Tax=Actinomadura citrea TaxID=46158 RepID=A0A7Y9KDB5_9ACTN|nr:hypothetical protein [Actinomadura citrea]NYE13240.1 hypothetical protein [Actinomadura citrea]